MAQRKAVRKDLSLRHVILMRYLLRWRSERNLSRFLTIRVSCLKHLRQAVPVWMQARMPCSSEGIMISDSVSFFREPLTISFFVFKDK